MGARVRDPRDLDLASGALVRQPPATGTAAGGVTLEGH